MTTKHNNILVLSLSGIGNFLMHTPFIEVLKKSHPDVKITAWVAPRGAQLLAKTNPYIDKVIATPIRRPFFLNVGLFTRLASQKFETSIMLSPGQLWKGSAYMFLAGIPQRIGHTYSHLNNHHSSFLLTDTINETESIHDIDQNLNLLALINVPVPDKPAQYHLNIPPQYVSKGRHILKKLSIPSTKTIMGIHPGSAAGFTWKRWPTDSFIRVTKHLIAKHNVYILIFGGPDEMSLKKVIRNRIGKKNSSIVNTNLIDTAAVMQHCSVFLSNDSGLMHLAAASGVKTFGLFGPTSEVSTGPRGPASSVIRAPYTKPVYNTETNNDFGSQTHDTLIKLKPEQVIEELVLALHSPDASPPLVD